MGPGKYENVRESQSVLIIINRERVAAHRQWAVRPSSSWIVCRKKSTWREGWHLHSLE
eukprot:COSAG01_NODE_4968_length_4584_cov_4.769008_1_plen_57_part_10